MKIAFRRSTQKTGIWGENKAATYLKQRGYSCIARNWRFRRGEIDLIALNGNTLAFIEVKTRKRKFQKDYPALLAVSREKQKRIERGAQIFLIKNKNFKEYSISFDIICVEYDSENEKIIHYQNAWR